MSRDLDALEWARRIEDPDFADWDAHIAWLEADPENAAAFDRMVLTIDAAAEALRANPGAVPANDNPAFLGSTAPRRRVSGFRWGMAMAAGIAALVGAGTVLRQQAPDARALAYATAPGQQRTLRLADGTLVAMNGDSAITIDTGRDRRVRIDRGEVYLNVVHDDARPLEVLAGDATMRDVGTRFNVRREGASLAVSVEEGAVDYEPDGKTIRLNAGQHLQRNGHTILVSRLDPSAIGGWRSGRLVYRDAPLSSVAVDLSRAIGEPVMVEQSAARIRFTGVLAIDRDHARVLNRLSAAANVRVRHDNAGWRIAASGR